MIALVAAVLVGGWSGSWWLGGLAAAGVYAVECAVWPWAYCWSCHGAGRSHRKGSRPGRGVFRDCWWCGGTGRRVRVGAALYARLRGR